MTDYERTVLEHYQLSTAYPTEWPSEKDNSDISDDEVPSKELKQNSALRKSKSRYSALQRAASDRRSIIGAQKSGDGTENLVQRDEPDPLGTTDSVVRLLRNQGLPVGDDIKLRNRFLLSSTTFSPALFLSQVHSTASTQSLLQGLDVLSRSIDQKSASLKVLVESNFERFVRAKATIDNVYMEMKNRGAEPAPVLSAASRSRTHSRHTSRNSFRNSSGGAQIIPFASSEDAAKKKNALTKESEFGVLGIKTPLIDVAAKAEEVWGPAIGGREKEEALKAISATVEQNKDAHVVGSAIADSIKRKDYEALVEEYGKAKRIADNAKRIADEVMTSGNSPSDAQIQQILVAARMWTDVQEQVEDFKRDVWKRLVAVHGPLGQQDAHMELITILLELGVNDNPIWVWLLSRYDYLKNKIQTTSERSRIEIEILRRRLASGKMPAPQVVASHLRSLGRSGPDGSAGNMDSSDIVELWERMDDFLSSLLSSQGILGEVTEFWQTVQGFIEGKTQKTLPVGIDGASREHHTLSAEGATELQKGTIELCDMIRDCVASFFSEPPIDDISALFSPLPRTPLSPNPLSGSFTPTGLRDPRFAFDAKNLPPPSPRLGEAFEKFAFWPPWSNSVSGVHYLAKLLTLVGSGASEMAAIGPVGDGDGSLDMLRSLVTGARERCVTAICAAWNKDAENIKVLEDWTRSPDKRDLTKIPANFSAFESSVLSGMQKILYIPEAMTKARSSEVVLPPPAKLLQMVRSQFVTTLYKALSGMVENAEKTLKKTDNDWMMEAQGLASPTTMITASSIGASTVNAGDRNVRMLLTLSNLQALRVDIVPSLTTQFENSFSVKLTDESKTIRDVLGQIDARLFQSYTRPSVDHLRAVIRAGILDPDWAPPVATKPTTVRPYAYSALLSLVLIHSQVSTTASSLTSQVLSYLFEKLIFELLEAFKSLKYYTLPALMQATLDVEFVAQTLIQYTTERAQEYQSQIYMEMDKGTGNDERAKLQQELPGMRAVLKGLREGSRNEFACFKKSRGLRGPGGQLERQQTG